MDILIRAMEESNVKDIVDGWNHSLLYDQIDENRFRRVILKDANYEKDSCLVATYGGKMAGFIAVIAREGIPGADNKGMPQQKDHGYIKGLFVLDEFRRKGIASRLLEEATEYLKSKNKSIIRILEYTGNYFFPGVDTRYESAIKFFENKGFGRDHTIDDVDLYITHFEPNDYHQNAKRRASKIGVSVIDYDPSMLDKMSEIAHAQKAVYLPPHYRWLENWATRQV